MAAFLVAEALGLRSTRPPLVAALTALLVVQATAASTLSTASSGCSASSPGWRWRSASSRPRRADLVEPGALVAASIVVGQLLRLGPHLVEVPISAMLVLGVGYTAGAEGWGRPGRRDPDRAAVGVLVNVLFPPAVRSRYAGQAAQRLAEEIAALLDEAAQGLGGGSAGPVGDRLGELFPTGTGWFSIPSVDRSSGDRGLTPEATARWLDDARRLNRHVPRVDRALPTPRRAAAQRPRAGQPARARGACAAGWRRWSSARSRCAPCSGPSTTGCGRGPPGRHRSAPRPAPRGRSCWPIWPWSCARSVRCCGPRWRAAATAEQAALTAALDRLRPDRERHAEVLLADPREHPDLWELNGALVVLIDRMLLELDAEAHARLWEGRPQAGRRAAELLKLLRSRRPPGERSTNRTSPDDPAARLVDPPTAGRGEPNRRDTPPRPADRPPSHDVRTSRDRLVRSSPGAANTADAS